LLVVRHREKVHYPEIVGSVFALWKVSIILPVRQSA
jgi:hypothetical protein